MGGLADNKLAFGNMVWAQPEASNKMMPKVYATLSILWTRFCKL